MCTNDSLAASQFGGILSGTIACAIAGPAIAGMLAWFEWKTTWYVGLVLWVLFLPVALHLVATTVRGHRPGAAKRLWLSILGLATTLSLLDLPLGTAGTLYAPLELGTSELASIEPATLPPVVKVTGALSLETLQDTTGLGRSCQTVPVASHRALVACDADLSAWEANEPRWARVHWRSGRAWEASARPAAMRAALGKTEAGVVFEAIVDADARIRTVRWRALGLTVLACLFWLISSLPLRREQNSDRC